MATVRHVTSSSGLRKFQADGFLFDRVYNKLQQDDKYITRRRSFHNTEQERWHSVVKPLYLVHTGVRIICCKMAILTAGLWLLSISFRIFCDSDLFICSIESNLTQKKIKMFLQHKSASIATSYLNSQNKRGLISSHTTILNRTGERLTRVKLFRVHSISLFIHAW